MSEIRVPLQGLATITYDAKEVHDISVGLLRFLASRDLPVSTSSLAVALTLGRLLAPEELSEEEESEFVKQIFQFCGLYFAEGSVN